MARRNKQPRSTEPKQPELSHSGSQIPAADDEMPDLDALRYELARKLMLIISDWRRCPKPACKRHRGCAAVDLECVSLPPERALTPDREAAEMAHFRRLLERRQAEIGRKR